MTLELSAVDGVVRGVGQVCGVRIHIDALREPIKACLGAIPGRARCAARCASLSAFCDHVPVTTKSADSPSSRRFIAVIKN